MDRGLLGRRTRWSILWVMVMLVASFTQAAVANEGQDPSTPDQIARDADELPDMPNVAPPKPGEINEAQLRDLARMAEGDGITLEEAIERYAWHESFSMLVADIREKYPDSFAGARIAPEGNPWIAFKSKAPEGVDALVGEFTTVVFGGSEREVDLKLDRGFTEAEIDNRLLRAHYAAFGQTDLVANASSGYDTATGTITVEVEPVEPLMNDEARANLAATVRSRDEEALRGIDLRVVEAIQSGDDTDVYGGHPLSPSCTSGFTVKNWNNSIRALTTAAHCGNSRSYPPSVTMTFQDEHDGYWGDVQWHTTSGTERDDFYANIGDRRDVSGVGDRAEGQALCRYGATTGYQCDTVYQRNHCLGSRCHLTIMHNREASGGDSGGPWFYGNTAYGIHSGYKFYWYKYRDTFTPAVYVDEALGLFIATY